MGDCRPVTTHSGLSVPGGARSLCSSPRPGGSGSGRGFSGRGGQIRSPGLGVQPGTSEGCSCSLAQPGRAPLTMSLLKKGCICLIHKKAVYGQSLHLSVVRISTSGSLLETRTRGPIPELWNQGPHSSSPGIPTSTLLFKSMAWGGPGSGISQLSPNTKSLPISLPKAALHSHRATPMKGVTWGPQVMRVGSARPPGFPFWFPRMPSCSFPRSSSQAFQRGCFWKLHPTLLGERALASLGKRGSREAPDQSTV